MATITDTDIVTFLTARAAELKSELARVEAALAAYGGAEPRVKRAYRRRQAATADAPKKRGRKPKVPKAA